MKLYVNRISLTFEEKLFTPMNKIVVKFGGSNLREKADILKLVHVIKTYNRPLVIVVSAFFGITNHLIRSLSLVRQSEGQVKELIHFLRNLKEEIIRENLSDETLAASTLRKVGARINELERYLTGVHYIGDVPDFVQDRVLSYGERLSSLILTDILLSKGIEAEEALPEEMPLVTDGTFGNGTVDYEKSTPGVRERLKGDKIYVVPGFYGISKGGKINLLGRGGSDYSAAALARCLDAESLDVWKDVDGFMSADPKLVDDPQLVKSLTYTEAAELAYFGAGILHPRTVEPLLEVKIPIHIANINTFNGRITPGTVVGPSGVIARDVIKSVTYNDDFTILKLRGAGVGLQKGILAKVSGAIDQAGINIKSVITSQIAINLLLSSNDIYKARDTIEALQLPTITELLVIEDVSIIAAVGEGILEQPGVAARIFSAVAQKNINVKMIASGASTVATYFMVAKADKELAVNAIHKAFFG